MTGNIHDVIDSAHQPIIAILVNAAAVTGKINIVIHCKVCINETIMVAPHCPHHSGPWFANAKLAAFVRVTLCSVIA